MNIRVVFFALCVAVLALENARGTSAQEVSAEGLGQTSATSGGSPQTTEVQPDGSGPENLVKVLLLAHLPRNYENAKKWGLTKPRWNGVSVSLDGLNVKTKRKWKEVNHGTWTRYQAWLIDPERELSIQFRDMRPVSTHRVAFELIVDAHVGAKGRLAEWNLGIQLFSVDAEADARIRMQMTCEVGLKLDATHFPPDVSLDPQVTAAKLALNQFDLHRVSDLDGPLVKNLGNGLRDDLEREINERQGKIVEKINRAINKNRDKLRLSPHDLVASGWNKLVSAEATSATGAILPASDSGVQSPKTARREE